MTTRVLIGLDGSPDGAAALDFALRWAARAGASLTGLTVVDAPGITAPEPTGIAGDYYKHLRDDALLADARPKARRLAEAFTRRCADAGVPGSVLEREGDAADLLIAAADEFAFVILGRRTHFHFETQEGPDDVAERVVRECRRAVLTVPSPAPGPRGVVVAYDGGDASAQALGAFAAASLDEGTPVRVLNIDPDVADATRLAAEGVALLGRYGLSAEPRPVTSGSVVGRLILAEAHAAGAHLVVAGAHHHAALWELLFGSTTETLLDRADVALFTHT
jgi:nucleotide-binding universal stress UspA family protein